MPFSRVFVLLAAGGCEASCSTTGVRTARAGCADRALHGRSFVAVTRSIFPFAVGFGTLTSRYQRGVPRMPILERVSSSGISCLYRQPCCV